ncbi:hypothetical protein ACLB2K_052648 [Fragaria x ananassa]
MTKEALYLLGATLGYILHDNPNLLSGARARHTAPLMCFDFVEDKDLTSMMFTFKYERVCSFYMSCRLLELKARGCQGPPDMSTTGLLTSLGIPSPPQDPCSNPCSRPIVKASGPVEFA